MNFPVEPVNSVEEAKPSEAIEQSENACAKCGLEDHPHQSCEQANMSDEEIRRAMELEDAQAIEKPLQHHA